MNPTLSDLEQLARQSGEILRLGYGRAARLIDMMEKDGIVGSPDGARPREVLKRPDWLKELDQSLR